MKLPELQWNLSDTSLKRPALSDQKCKLRTFLWPSSLQIMFIIPPTRDKHSYMTAFRGGLFREVSLYLCLHCCHRCRVTGTVTWLWAGHGDSIWNENIGRWHDESYTQGPTARPSQTPGIWVTMKCSWFKSMLTNMESSHGFWLAESEAVSQSDAMTQFHVS